MTDINLYRELALAGAGAILTHEEAIRAELLAGQLQILKSYPQIICRAYLTLHDQGSQLVNPADMQALFK